MREKGEEIMNNEEYNKILNSWIETVKDVVIAMTSGHVTPSCDDLIMIEFLIRRFGISIVENALDNIGAVSKEGFFPTLRKLCTTKYLEVYGVK
jgi:hypothetical protein